MNRVDEGTIRIEQPRVPTLSLVISLFSLFLISLGALSIFALQKPIAETQQIASQAAVSSGKAAISSDQNPNPFYDHQLNTVNLKLNTQGQKTRGVTTIFNVVTSTTDNLALEFVDTSNLKPTSQEVQKTSNGFLVKVVAVPAGTGPFSSNSDVPFLKINFNPHRSGEFSLIFDQVYSHVYLEDGKTEALGFVPRMNFTVMSDTTPDTTTTTVRSCNQGCADNRQCQTGLTCFENRCRAPGNPDSTTCSAVTQTSYSSIVKSCNVACSTNRECAVNMRCYQGSCRLATNPSSTSCTPSNVPIVSESTGTKGEEIVYVTPTPIATQSGTVTPSPTPSATPFTWPSPTPLPAVTPEPTVDPTPEVTPDTTSVSWLDRLRALSPASGLSFPVIAVISGATLLIIALLLLLTRGTRAPKGPMTARKAPLNPRPASPEEQSLEQRIAELKANQNAPIEAPQAKVAVSEMSVPPSTLTLQSAPVSATPESGEDSSTMMQRLREKGLTSGKIPSSAASDEQK